MLNLIIEISKTSSFNYYEITIYIIVIIYLIPKLYNIAKICDSHFDLVTQISPFDYFKKKTEIRLKYNLNNTELEIAIDYIKNIRPFGLLVFSMVLYGLIFK